MLYFSNVVARMSLRFRLIVLALLTVVCLLITIPSTWKDSWNAPSWLAWVTEPSINKGLDLAGGVGLDFAIDLSKVPEDRKAQVLSGIRQVLNGRVNTLGVSEPEIVFSTIGDEQHVKVTLAGVNDIEEAKKIIGKTIQLEFKVPREKPDDQRATTMRTMAEAFAKDWAAAPDTLKTLLEKARETEPGNVYSGTKTVVESTLDPALVKVLSETNPGEWTKEVVEATLSVDSGDELSTVRGMVAAKLTKKGTELVRSPKNGLTMDEVQKEYGSGAPVALNMVKPGTEAGDRAWMQKQIADMEPGQISDVLETEQGYVVLKMNSKYTADQEVMKASHILFTTSQEGETTGTPEEAANRDAVAKKSAEDLLARIQADPTKFAELAKENTQEPGGKERAGDLGYFTKGMMVPEFETAAFALEPGQVSGVVKTQFGYHIIQAVDKKPKGAVWADMSQVLVCFAGATDASCAKSTVTKDAAKKRAEEAMTKLREEKVYGFEYALFNTSVDPWEPAVLDGKQLTGEYFKKADAVYQQGSMVPIVRIEFNDEGARLFEQLTEKYVGKPMAIFVGGQLISSPTIRSKIPGGVAVIEGGFTVKTAVALARDLNTGAIPAPITLSGQEIVGPELGQGAFEKSILAGLVGIVLLSLYLTAYYRLSGFLAVLSLFVYTIMYVTVIKLIPGFNLTLASVAALVLSVGMAVDGNVLIFERFREEMKNGSNVSANIKKAFERAWTAIRDSQVSSLITALILFMMGTEAVKGFAVYLIFGILLSLFTSIWVTRVLMQACGAMGLYTKGKK